MIYSMRWLRLLLAVCGGVLIFLGERTLAAHQAGPVLMGVGLALLVVLPLLVAWQRRGAARGALALEAAPAALFLLAALLYLAAQAIPQAEAAGRHWRGIVTWAWALTLLLGLFPFLFVEMSLWSQGHSQAPAPERLRRALEAGLSLGLVLCLVVALNFVFNRLEWRWDLAYFKTTDPSSATMQLVEGLGEPVEVAVFFPENHVILSLLRSYLQPLAAGQDNLNLNFYDAELHPVQARDFKARQNGSVVLRKGKVRKEISVGTALNRARARLSEFDSSFFSAMLEVSQERRMAYITVGHGERNERPAAKNDPRSGVVGLRALLAERNFTVKNLGLGQGLGREVPSDAALVVVLGPTEPFLRGEAAALKSYLKKGGRLLVFLDPETAGAGPRPGKRAKGPLLKLLQGYGLTYTPVVQAHDRFHARRTFGKADRGLLVTIAYGNHPSVSALRRKAGQNPLLLLGAGAWQKGKPPAGMVVQDVVKGMGGTWGDRNGNYEFDKGAEKRAQPLLAVAVSPKAVSPKALSSKETAAGKTTPEGPHILGFADADFALDFLLQNRTNRLLLAESIRWVTAGDLPPGLTGKEKDVKIIHAKGDEWVWFYLPVFAVPLLMLGLGFWFSGRPGMKRGA